MTIFNRTRTLLIPLSWVVFTTIVAAESVQAASINSSLDPALDGAAVIDFESVTPGEYSTFSIGDVTFSTTLNGQQAYISNAYAGEYNTQGQSLQNTYASNAFTTLRIDFSNPVSAFGFNWGASNEAWTLKAFDAGNNLLDSFSLPLTWASNAGDFYGIEWDNSQIRYATLEQSSVAYGADYVFIDNFKYAGNASAIPTPALLPGLIGMGVAAWRKRQGEVEVSEEA